MEKYKFNLRDNNFLFKPKEEGHTSEFFKYIFSFHMSWTRVKLMRAIAFMKYLASFFNISSENFNLEQIHLLCIKFAESCRAGGKGAYNEYLEKFYQHFFFYSIYHCLM